MTDEHQDLSTKYALLAQKTELELQQIHKRFSEQVDVFEAHTEEEKAQSEKHINILEKISDQVDQTQKCLDKLNGKVDLSTQKLQSEIEKINQLDEIQNQQLAAHIKGVNTNTERLELEKKEAANRHDTLQERVSELEKPREWLRTTKKGIIGIGGLAAAAYAVLKLLEVI